MLLEFVVSYLLFEKVICVYVMGSCSYSRIRMITQVTFGYSRFMLYFSPRQYQRSCTIGLEITQMNSNTKRYFTVHELFCYLLLNKWFQVNFDTKQQKSVLFFIVIWNTERELFCF